MSKTRTTRPSHLTCNDVRFVKVDFLRQLHPKVVIEFSEGLSLLLEDQVTVPLTAEFVSAFRKHLAAKGGRP